MWWACGSGTYEDSACVTTSNRECRDCSYSNGCLEGSYETRACTPTTDRTCRTCSSCMICSCNNVDKYYILLPKTNKTSVHGHMSHPFEYSNVSFVLPLLFFTMVIAIIVTTYYYYLKRNSKDDNATPCDGIDEDILHEDVIVNCSSYPIVQTNPLGFSLEKNNIHHSMLSRATVGNFFKIM